jgi:hypothetical protein
MQQQCSAADMTHFMCLDSLLILLLLHLRLFGCLCFLQVREVYERITEKEVVPVS